MIRRLLLFLNIFSLDAPLVTLIWCRYLATTYQWNVSQAEYGILFLVTWLAYSGDRLLDAMRIKIDEVFRPRYRFAKAYRWEGFAIWICALFVTSILVTQTISIDRLMVGIMLSGLVGAYFAVCQYWPPFRLWLPRELAVAVIVVSGVIFFPLFDARHISWEFWADLMGMILLCLVNGVGIACWEFHEDQKLGEVTIATSYPGIISFYGAVVVVSGVVLISVGVFIELEISTMLTRVGTSFLLLGLIDRLKQWLFIRPTLADLAIAVPFLVR